MNAVSCVTSASIAENVAISLEAYEKLNPLI